MIIALAADHAGFALKQLLAQWLREEGREVIDLGADSDARVDYPVYGYKLGQSIASGAADLGIAVCGSGIGIAIAANRNSRVRCAQVADPLSARLARLHNDANCIALGARLIGEDMAKACVHEFLSSRFEGGRHAARVDLLSHPTSEQDPA